MDNLQLEGEELRSTLKQLTAINYWLGGDGVTINALNKILENFEPGKLVRIVDLGCGGGDSLKAVATWARAKKIKVELIGIDANEFTINYARKETESFPEIEFKQLNIFSEEFQKLKADVFICGLFLHHFKNEEIVAFLQTLMKQKPKAIIINDLQRHWLPFALFQLVCFIFRASHMVRYDGSISIMRGFKRKDLPLLVKQAGFACRQQWRWAFRWQNIVSPY